jgi:hypothetical protein
MKLNAFGDRKADVDKDLGRHHALDAYTIVGMITEPEYERAKVFGAADRGEQHVRRTREIVATDFSSPTSEGVLRMREHALFRPEFRLNDFIAVLREVFGVVGGWASSTTA